MYADTRSAKFDIPLCKVALVLFGPCIDVKGKRYGMFCLVLVECRRSEKSYNRISNDLVDGCAIHHEKIADTVEVGVELVCSAFRCLMFAQSGKAFDVREDADD